MAGAEWTEEAGGVTGAEQVKSLVHSAGKFALAVSILICRAIIFSGRRRGADWECLRPGK
ncbi:MAG TPA: hypothetical protein VFU57_13600 [Candidatus Acidoferrales bacterium]|nr:hypothetical protein [Candidatus Acidoferrales bacterium]